MSLKVVLSLNFGWLLLGMPGVIAQENKPFDPVIEPTLEQVIQRNCQPPQPVSLQPNIILAQTVSTSTPAGSGITTNQTISQRHITPPSLWLSKELYAGKLVSSWVAYAPTNQEPGRVDLIVNRQYWSLLTYLERYQITNKFGVVAWDFGYNLRIFNPQGNFLAAYTCATNVNSPLCRVCLDSTVTPRR